MHPTLLVPGVRCIVLMNPSIKGLLTLSRWVTSHGPSVAPTCAVFAALSTRESCSRTLRGGSALFRNSMGREFP